jgi:hypothetical protein
MNQGKMVFAQVMEIAPYHVFKHCVNRYNGDYKVQDFTCWHALDSISDMDKAYVDFKRLLTKLC